MDKKYIELKIKNCQQLVDTTISEERKKIYQGYLDFWEEKLGIPKPKKEEIIVKNYKGDWVEPDELDLSEETEGVDYAKIPEPEEPEPEEPEPEIEPLRDDPEGVKEELRATYEKLFKLEYPYKQAYYVRDGQKLETKAFTEFLNKKK